MSSINCLKLYRGIITLNPKPKVIFLSALDAIEELVSVLPGVDRNLFSKAGN
jgi:hypothetical protein